MHDARRLIGHSVGRSSARSRGANSLQGLGTEPVAVSPARMAAEAAFSDRPGPLTQPIVKVTVLRKRGLASSSMPPPGGATPGTGDHAERASRVFTLRPAAAIEAEGPSDPGLVGMDTPTEVLPARLRRRRGADRVGHDTRARLIRHVRLVDAELQDQHQADASPAQQLPQATDRTMPAVELFAAGIADPAFETETPASLMRRLRRIEALLDEARAAQALSFLIAER